jgi:hypothetical protein
MGSRVTHGSGGGGGRKPEEGKGAASSRRLAPWWCLRSITKTQKTSVADVTTKGVGRKERGRGLGLLV